jgi:hypothetical protein
MEFSAGYPLHRGGISIARNLLVRKITLSKNNLTRKEFFLPFHLISSISNRKTKNGEKTIPIEIDGLTSLKLQS